MIEYPLDGMPARSLVPEPAVKDLLAALGVRVPRGVTMATGDHAANAAGGLSEPLVVKAFGPGIVHKSDIGAVRLGVPHDDVERAMQDMTSELDRHGVRADGFLVEEQHEPAVELLIGVVRGPFGPVIMLALGGILTEALDLSVSRLLPLTRDEAIAMLDDFPARGVLEAARGGGVERDALVDLLLAIAGPDGLAVSLGARLAELECNPVAAGPGGAVALDARLVLHDPRPAVTQPPATDFGPLFAPRAVAVAGASTKSTTFGNRFLAAYRDAGWRDGLFAIHPTASEIDGVPAYPSVADVPAAVDYLLAAVPAAGCANLVATCADRVPFVHVVSGGFGETGPEGADLEASLRDAARDAGVRLLGPNCMGVFAPAGRQTFQLDTPTEVGHVGVVSQSGALAGDIVKGGDRRGIRFSKLVTVGNAVDVTSAELVEHLLDDDDTRVIGLYVEGSRDGERLVAALRRAAGRKPVVVLPAGTSRQGAAAAMSHTGSLAGDDDAWSAIAASTGTAVVHTLEDLLAVLVFAQRYSAYLADADSGVLVVGPGGGAAVLATDACDRHGLDVSALGATVRARLRELGLGAGTSTANPVEIPVGPATGPDVFDAVLDAVLDAQPFADVLVHVNVQSYFSYGTSGADPLIRLLEHLVASQPATTRAALVLRNLDCAPPAAAAEMVATVIGAGLPVFTTFDEAATAIAALQQFCVRRPDQAG